MTTIPNANKLGQCLAPEAHRPHHWWPSAFSSRYCPGRVAPPPTFGRIERPAESDPVHHPQHYMKHPSGVEIIDITRHHSFVIGNALKYIFRHEHKGQPVQDLKKAIAYLEFAIEDLEKEGK